MRVPIAILFVFSALVLSASSSADTKPDAQVIAQLVQQLGSPKYAERETATQQLDAIGAPALEALRKAAQGEDAEVRRRAQSLVRKIEKRQDAAQLIAPQRIRLTFQDTPVEQAVAEIAKKTGFTIKLEGNRALLADRKVTLDTGETTFWEAFDQFCAKAELVEVTPAPAADRAPNRTGVSGSIVIMGGGNPKPTAKDIMNPDPAEKPVVLTLGAGKPRETPIQYSGALRLQTAPAGSELASQKKGPGETLFALEVMAEPSIRWERVIGLRIDRAIDDEGQSLVQLATTFTKPAPPAPKNTGTVTINGVQIGPDPPAPEGFQKQAPIRLKLGDRPAKMLKELSGTISAQVRSPIEPLVTVDNILTSAEKTFKGTREGTIKMIAVKRQDDGQVHLQFQVEPPPGKIGDGSAAPTPNMTVIINGQVVGQQEQEPLSAANFTLLDDKGRPFKVIKASNTGRQTGATQELEFTYQPNADQGEPARFIYSGRRASIIEIPFKLKDVPLP